jgi:hypothetical protein
MRITLLFAGIILATVFFAGCQNEGTVAPPLTNDPNVTAIRLIDTEIQAAQCDSNGGKVNRNFIGILSGREEVPPTDSKGRGVAIFKVSKDTMSISYKLIVANITGVVGAEINKGAAGENGPAVFALYSDTTDTGRSCGPIAQGTLKPEDLVGPYAGSTDFKMFLHADSLYVNVRTSDGIDSTSGKPGDYIDGEIRGQLMGLPPWFGEGWGHDGDDDHHGKKDKHGKGHDKGKGKGHDKNGDGEDDHRNGGGDQGGDDDHKGGGGI